MNFVTTLINQVDNDINFKKDKNGFYNSVLYNASVFIDKDVIIISTLKNKQVIENIIDI